MLKKTLIATAVLAVTTQLALANGGTYMPVEQKRAQYDSNFYLGVGGNLNSRIGIELFGGYGVHWSNIFYTGFELFGVTNAHTFKDYSYGARFMPGIHLADNIIAFGNIGYVRGTLFTQANNGIQFGAGLQAKVLDQVSLRGGWNRNQKVNQFYLSAIYHFPV